jgi:hypothetical protein
LSSRGSREIATTSTFAKARQRVPEVIQPSTNLGNRSQSSASPEPARQPEAVTAGLEGDCNPFDPMSCFLRLLPPAIEQFQQRALIDRGVFNGERSTPATIPATSQLDWPMARLSPNDFASGMLSGRTLQADERGITESSRKSRATPRRLLTRRNGYSPTPKGSPPSI